MMKKIILSLIILNQTVFADTLWKNGSEFVVGGKGWEAGIGTYHRLPDAAKGKVPSSVWKLSAQSAGLNVEFETDSESITCRWRLTSENLSMPHMPATGVSGIDLYCRDEKDRWFYVSNFRPGGKETTSSIHTGNTSSKMGSYLLYLPLYNGVESLEIGISEGSRFAQRTRTKVKPIVYYGTSITQGGCASRPGMAFTAILQRRLDREIVNLGFSGSGKMEPIMADFLAQIDASVFVLDCLWNLSRAGSEVIEQRVVNFAQTLRKAHPETPILFVEQSHFKGPFPTRASQAQRKGIETLKKQGVNNIHMVAGDELIGKDGDGTVDGCHPNDLGMTRHAEILLPVLKKLIK